MICALCNKEFEGGYAIGNFNVCDDCGKQYSLKTIQDKLNEINKNELQEDATQVSNIGTNKVSIFGDNKNNIIENSWYEQLFEDKEFNEDDFKIKSSHLEDTGGHTMVLYGQLQNGQYFGLNEETLALYDEDYYKAYLQSEEIDIFEWSSNHLINVYNNDDMEYQLVANQTEEFKPYVDKDNIIEESLYELVKYLNLNTNLDWDYNEIYDNCAISEDDEDYIEIFVNLNDNNEVYYTINKNDNSDNKKYINLEDIVKAL